MERVAIFGVGLVGGSFALALRQAGFKGEILGVSSTRTINEAIRLGVVDRGVSLDEAAAQADLLYLAQPIGQIITTIGALAGKARPGALITDAGSTKTSILDEAGLKIPGVAFLGGHPMAGKEVRGVQAADPAIFPGRTYFLSVRNQSVLDHPVAEDLVEYIQKFGCRPVLLSPEDHDRLVAFTSHLPQMASTALAATLSRLLDPESARKGAGPGLIDMTRLAQSSYDLWQEIVFTNMPAIDRALSLYIRELQEIRESLQQRDLSSTFDKASRFSAIVRNRDS
ncbi:MAG: prephenate dehydrogenase/arogenate dehydrogenase family protein [Acidobacteria bacterium]|nr:prephenate dehydrogenase/arogenate dehydrogenase family protein [Acidobacteriota bacterium]